MVLLLTVQLLKATVLACPLKMAVDLTIDVVLSIEFVKKIQILIYLFMMFCKIVIMLDMFLFLFYIIV